MGTYSDSKIVTARKPHRCGQCGSDIAAGDRYLVYKLGLRNDTKRCLDCATSICAATAHVGRLQYDCAAVRAELGLPPRIGAEG